MTHELAVWNVPALITLQRLIDGAAGFDVKLQDTEIKVSIAERCPSQWPDPPPSGLSPRTQGKWPDSLRVRAEWAGGATDLKVSASETSGRYEGLVALVVETRTGGQLLWLNMPSVLSKHQDGVADLCLLTAVTKRQDNTEQNQALALLARNSGMSFGTRKKVSIGRVRSSGELLSEPIIYWRNLISFCLLKLPFYSSNPRDFDGPYFLTAASAREHPEEEPSTTLTTVVGTSHAGLMIPVLEALSHGPQDASSIEQRVFEHFGSQLTPGDKRKKRDGRVLWRYNTRWALSYLKQRGEAENPARRQWSLTAAGRRRLEHERSDFDIRAFQTLNAKVLSDDPLIPSPQLPSSPSNMPPVDRTHYWQQQLTKLVDTATLERLSARLRPDLGPSPIEPIARNVILVGPPGTGKTWLAEKLALALTGEQPSTNGAVRLVQFHPSYGYEDFVWSIRPVLSGDATGFREAPGPFMSICKDAIEDPDELYVLIIDEINRGDPARIFGELLYALEYRGREVLLASGGALTVPTNLVLLGTMNSVDRSVGMIDYALRRRFGFVRIEPLPSLISKVHGTKASFVAAEALTKLNRAIRELGDPELQLGHSYFLSPGRALVSQNDLGSIWALDLAPQLAELFHGRGAILEQLTRTWNDALQTEVLPPQEDELEEDDDDEEDTIDEPAAEPR